MAIHFPLDFPALPALDLECVEQMILLVFNVPELRVLVHHLRHSQPVLYLCIDKWLLFSADSSISFIVGFGYVDCRCSLRDYKYDPSWLFFMGERADLLRYGANFPMDWYLFIALPGDTSLCLSLDCPLYTFIDSSRILKGELSFAFIVWANLAADEPFSNSNLLNSF